MAWFLSNLGGQIRTPFQIELGFSYLYVRGDCHYWVSTSGFESHHGVLDAVEPGVIYELQVRDAVPFEGEDGLIPRFWAADP